jgi:predicted RNA-binding protein YlqC (UPF0109 family)
VASELTVSELIEAIARALVDNPDKVSVEETSNQFGRTLRLRVDPSEVGLVIGNQGRTARSLRTILGAISVKLKYRYSLEIVDGFVADRNLEEK